MESDGELASLLASISKSAVALTRSANQVAAEDIEFQRGLTPSFGRRLDQQNARLLAITERLVGNAAVGPEAVRPRLPDADSIDGNWRSIVDVLDSLLERADTSLDEFSGAIKRLSPARELAAATTAPQKKLSAAHRNQDMVKPQLLFEHKFHNNERGPFQPLLLAKPFSTRSLKDSLTQETGQDGQSHTPHPYRTEIQDYEYPSRVYTRAEPISYSPFDSTTATLVDTEEAMEAMLEELKTAKEIAIDLEHHDTRSYVGLVSLMQISTRNKDWIVDTLKPWRRKLSCLNEVFADPKIIKVLHGAHMDIIWLQRDFGLYIVGLFDTYFAARALGYPGGSLAYLLKRFVNFDAQKQYQMADWRIRPLPVEMFEYARSDTHFLLYVYDNMRNELIDRSSFAVPDKDLDKIHTVLTKSKEVALQTYEYSIYDPVRGLGPGGWYKMLARTAHNTFNKAQFGVFRALHQWRDEVAREQDDSVNFVLPNHALFTISKDMPTDQARLLGLVHPIPQTVKLRSAELLGLIAKAKATADTGKDFGEALREVEIYLHGEALTDVPTSRAAAAVRPQTDSKTVAPASSPRSGLGLSALRSNISSLWRGASSGGQKRGMATVQPQLVIPIPPPELLALFSSAPADTARMVSPPATPVPIKSTPEDDGIFTLRGSINKRKADALAGDAHDSLAAQTDEVTLGDADLQQRQEEKKRRKAERKAAKRAKKDSEAGLYGEAQEDDAASVGEVQQVKSEPFDYAAAPSVLHAQANAAAEAKREKKGKDKGARAKQEPFGFAKGLNDVAKGLGRRQKETPGRSMTFKD